MALNKARTSTWSEPMHTDLSDLPDHKRQELDSIVQLIRAKAEVEQIILFGSYARGEWVEDKYVKDGITYEYRSDFDLMVVLDCEHESAHGRKWNKIREAIRGEPAIKTPVSLITEDVRHVNRELERGQYFYTDVKREGRLLYDSGKWELAETRKLDPAQRAEIAQGHFDRWYQQGINALKMARFATQEAMPRDAAFMLHQATERFLFAVILVHTDYKPKTHSIGALHQQVRGLDTRFVHLFPQATDFERQAYDRLKRAYTEARFEPDYEITAEELDWLTGQVEELQRQTDAACREKIGEMGGNP